jgi:hypothetical protein
VFSQVAVIILKNILLLMVFIFVYALLKVGAFFNSEFMGFI